MQWWTELRSDSSYLATNAQACIFFSSFLIDVYFWSHLPMHDSIHIDSETDSGDQVDQLWCQSPRGERREMRDAWRRSRLAWDRRRRQQSCSVPPILLLFLSFFLYTSLSYYQLQTQGGFSWQDAGQGGRWGEGRVLHYHPGKCRSTDLTRRFSHKTLTTRWLRT